MLILNVRLHTLVWIFKLRSGEAVCMDILKNCWRLAVRTSKLSAVT